MSATLPTQTIDTGWKDLTVDQPQIALRRLRIRNPLRNSDLEVIFSGLSAQPDTTMAGERVSFDQTIEGLAAHVWVRSTGSKIKPMLTSLDAASSAPLTGTVNDVAAHIFGPFTPQLAREIWATLVGTGAVGTAQLMRSTDAGVTKAGLTAGGDAWASWSFSGVTGPIVNEQIGTETDAAATWWLAVTLTAGSLTYRIAQ